MKDKKQRIAIVGAGHNGLVCANYLARAGLDVTLFEKRSTVGGLCVTEELFEGFQVSSVASYYGMLRPEIVGDLQLHKFGLEPYLTNPAEVVLLGDGQYIFTPRDEGSKYHLGGTKPTEIHGWQNFWKDIAGACDVLSPLYFAPSTTQAQAVDRLRTAGLGTVADSLFEGTLLSFCRNYFSNEYLLAAAATCTPGFANRKDTVFGCIHHGTANTAGRKGAWGLCKGGMGSVTQALLKSAIAAGLRVVTDCAVEQLDRSPLGMYTLLLENGKEECFDVIASGCDLKSTCQRLLKHHPVSLSTAAIGEHQLSAGKVHFALNSLPKFSVLDELGCGYSGIIVSAPPLEQLLEDSARVYAGELPQHPMMTMAIPSVTDTACAPDGKHLLTVDLHHLPLQPVDGWSSETKSLLMKRIFDELSRHCADFERHIDSFAVVTPDILQTRYGVASGSCWHVPLAAEFLFEGRNAFGHSGYRTHLPNVYVCGAGTYGGGNVSGVPGLNCAREILRDLSSNSSHGVAGYEYSATEK